MKQSEQLRSLLSRKKSGQTAHAHRDDAGIPSYPHYAVKIWMNSTNDEIA